MSDERRIPNPIRKSPPTTESERFVAELCERTALSLWSYPCVYQDKGAARTGEGKELSDLLVVFENDILIFSDKHCQFPDTGNLDLDWGRWYRRAILRAADQLWGAERWLREHPDRVFVDRACKIRFPVPLPNAADTRYHLIVVAHGSTDAGRGVLGGSGGLVITNTLEPELLPRKPFSAGDLDRRRSFVHVFDDVALPVALTALDTISDLVTYLVAKERLLRSDTPVLARAEEDLLTVYLTHINDAGQRSFPVLPAGEGMFVDGGEWEKMLQTEWWRRERELDELSYAWDHMIESFAGHTLSDTRQFSYPHDDFSGSEKILRLLAREPRMRRRTLARAWLEALVKSEDGMRYTRWIVPTSPGQVYWVFLFFRVFEAYRTNGIERSGLSRSKLAVER